MFTSLNVSDRSRVTSIAAQWDGREEDLRELARSGQLVCPGCEQLLWLRTGDVRRRHFAHRDLSECQLGKQSSEVLEAKAQLFTWLETVFPGRVQIDMELNTPGIGHVPDLVVETEDGPPFTYWIFDRQIRNRDGYPKPRENKTERTHYIHTESTWKLEPEKGTVLSASQRHFISYSTFDLALDRPGIGHLHFFSTTDSTLRIYRGLRCIHGPALHDWEELREGSLASALVCPKSGELIFGEDVTAVEQIQQNPGRSRPIHSRRSPAKIRHESHESESASKAAELANYLNRTLRCEECGVETKRWSSANPSNGTCVCKECSHKRWLNLNSDLEDSAQ
jgi:hypothetical protein